MELTALARDIDELFEAGRGQLGTGETVLELERQLSRLQALVAHAAAEFSRSGDWREDGARSCGAWLAARTNLPKPECRRQVKLGTFASLMTHAGAGWRAGDIGTAQVQRLRSLRNRRTYIQMNRDEEMLVGFARTLSFDEFDRAAAYWEQHADPDGADESDEERRNRRDVYLTQSVGGMFLGRITLDPLSGAAVSGELGRREQELFEKDWAEARDRLGREPMIEDLARTPSQRRADALVEMASRSAAMSAGARRPAPLFSVLVGYETLHGRICQLAQGTPVSPGALLPWLDQAYVERAVFGLNGRVECSEQARLFTGATRRAIELRDRTCRHPFCDEPMDRCQVDHVVPYSEGGPTTQENGQLLCGFHNRTKCGRPPPPDDG